MTGFFRKYREDFKTLALAALCFALIEYFGNLVLAVPQRFTFLFSCLTGIFNACITLAVYSLFIKLFFNGEKGGFKKHFLKYWFIPLVLWTAFALLTMLSNKAILSLTGGISPNMDAALWTGIFFMFIALFAEALVLFYFLSAEAKGLGFKDTWKDLWKSGKFLLAGFFVWLLLAGFVMSLTQVFFSLITAYVSNAVLFNFLVTAVYIAFKTLYFLILPSGVYFILGRLSEEN